MSSTVRLRATVEFEYSVTVDDRTEEAYGTLDPVEMARVDQEQMLETGDVIFMILEDSDVTNVTVEPVE